MPGQPPPIPPPLPRAALTISLEPSNRPEVRAPSELVIPKHLEADPLDSDTITPQLGIPTLGPNRPNVDLRRAENQMEEPTATIAPIPAQRSRTVLVIAIACAVGVLGAAGVLLYSALAGGGGNGDAKSETVAEPAALHTMTATAGPTVTPIVEAIPVEPTPTAPVVAEPAKTPPPKKRIKQRAEAKPRVEADRAGADEKVAQKTTEDVVEKPTKATAAKGAAKAAPADTAAKAPGVLMLGAKPPCAIHIDGRDTGLKTPQRKIDLSPGTHEVTLVNEAYDIRERFSVKITSGEKKRVIKDMTDRITP